MMKNCEKGMRRPQGKLEELDIKANGDGEYLL